MTFEQHIEFDADDEDPLIANDERITERSINEFIAFEGNISQAGEVRDSLILQPTSWLNNSRKRLLTIWGPFQLLTILLVTYFSVSLYSVPPEQVKVHNR